MFYLLPYFEFKMVNFFGYHFESWRVLWLFGRVAVIYLMLHEANRLKLSMKTIWAVFLIGLLFISFFERLLFYLSHQFLHNDGAMFHFNPANWEGLGRVYFGTLIGIFFGVIIGTLITRQAKDFLKYLDVNLTAQVAGTFLYRIGNLLWHAHPGTITNSFLGMYYEGQIRHEPTLYELISLAILFTGVWKFRTKINSPGTISLIILGWMSLSRFITDFFRSTDLVRSNFHFQNGLTLNQVAYGTLFVLCAGILLFIYGKKFFYSKNDLQNP